MAKGLMVVAKRGVERWMRSLLLWGLILGVLSGVGFAETLSFYDQTLEYDQQYRYDLDGDGYQELMFHMKGDELVLAVWDLDGDQLNDKWFAYGAGDVLEMEARDLDHNGEPDQYFSMNEQDERIPMEMPSRGIQWMVPLGIVILLLLVLWGVKRKKGHRAVAGILILVLLGTGTSSFAEGVLNEDCTINESVFNEEWLKYSHIDERIDVQARSPEAQEVQAISDELKFQYEAYAITEFDLELERQKRSELKTIKKLLVRNIKNNLLKAFMRLTYVTYDTIQVAKGNKGSVEAILDKTTSGVQIITSYIKIRKSLKKPSKIASQKKTMIDRAKGLSESYVLEYLDTAGDPKKLAVHVINDLQKEAFDIVKTEDNWSDPKLSDADFKLLRDQYLKNHDYDALIAESDKIISQLLDNRKAHLEAIETLESQYHLYMAREKARVREVLIQGCKDQKEKNEEEDEEEDVNTSEPAVEPTVEEPVPDGIPTAKQLEGDYKVHTDATVHSEDGTQNTSGVTAARIEFIDDRTIRLLDFTDAVLDVPYNPETGTFSVSQTVEELQFSISGKAFIEDGQVTLQMQTDGGAGSAGSFHMVSTAYKEGKTLNQSGIPSKVELVGLYQMSAQITEVRNGKSETGTTHMEVSITNVDGMIGFVDPANNFTSMALNYDEASGSLWYDYSDDEMILTIRGTAQFSGGIVQMTITSEQYEDDYSMNASYAFRKID